MTPTIEVTIFNQTSNIGALHATLFLEHLKTLNLDAGYFRQLIRLQSVFSESLDL
jgi:hypothetical protein